MKISIVTPCFNRADYLNSTIESVLLQQGDFSLEYIIQDGGDSAEVESILDRWAARVASGEFDGRCRSIDFRVMRERDGGMYDGLNRGFARSEGEIMAWINSDDVYHPGAFQTVSEALSQNPSVYWIAGIANSFNGRGSRTGFDSFPPAYSREFVKRGLYRSENSRFGLTWIPQDNVFWRRPLWEAAGGRIDSQYRYAADFHLWRAFAEHAELVKLYSFLGGYRFHGDQITADPALYLSEIPPHENPPVGWQHLHRLLSAAPRAEKLIFNVRRGYPILPYRGVSFDMLTGHVLRWSFQSMRWDMSLSKAIG